MLGINCGYHDDDNDDNNDIYDDDNDKDVGGTDEQNIYLYNTN